MKTFLKSLLPRAVVLKYDKYKRAREHHRNRSRTTREVFSEIYSKKAWGGAAEPFCSGTGSATSAIVVPYVALIKEHLRSYGANRPRVVDLGCGDFSVGSQLVEDCSEYTGVDVVPDLIQHLQSSNADGRTKFVCLDMIEDDLPAGDVCLIRQVFQHLSNPQIAKVLAKLSRYPVVFVTEHHPADEPGVVPNRDKAHGGGIRLFDRSGVYLDQPPFNVPSSDMKLVLEVPGHEFEGLYEPGVIRTFQLAFPGNARRAS